MKPHPVRRRPDPSAAKILEALDGRVYGVVAPEPVGPNPLYPGVWDLHGDDPTAFHVGFTVGGGDDVRVTTTIEKPRPDNVITNLLLRTIHHAADDDQLRFPLNLSVARTQLRLALDEKERRFTAYGSSGRASATAPAGGGIFVIVECPERQLGRIALHTMSLEEIENRLYRPRR